MQYESSMKPKGVNSSFVECGTLDTPNGSTNGTLSVIGAVRILTCNVGYQLQGDGVIRCEESGYWSVTSTCTIIGTSSFIY